MHCIVYFILFYFCFVQDTGKHLPISILFQIFFFFFLSPLNQFSTLQTLWSIWLWDPDSTNDQCDCQVESFLFFISTLNYAWSHHWNLSAWYLSSFFFPLLNTFIQLARVMFGFISPWIRLEEVPRFHFIKPSSENRKCFIYKINLLKQTNTTFFFFLSLWRKGWRCLLEQSASQRWKLLLFVWCFGSLLDILRWNRKDSHYHIEMSALRKKVLSFMKKELNVSKQKG